MSVKITKLFICYGSCPFDGQASNIVNFDVKIRNLRANVAKFIEGASKNESLKGILALLATWANSSFLNPGDKFTFYIVAAVKLGEMLIPELRYEINITIVEDK